LLIAIVKIGIVTIRQACFHSKTFNVMSITGSENFLKG